MAPEAVRVCRDVSAVRQADKVRQTLELTQQGAPVIAQPALWWAPERIYGAPDLIVHSDWLREKYPGLGEALQGAGNAQQPGHYLAFDLKFSTRLDSREKVRDLAAYAAQLRLYSYMLVKLQGYIPRGGYMVARDRAPAPPPVEITASLDQPLDS